LSYKITVLKLDITKAPKGYSVAEVAYKTDDGKTKGMKVLDFVQKDVFETLKSVKAGDVLNADFEKNAKGFWQFAQLSKTGETAAVQSNNGVSSSAGEAKKSPGNWETSTERAARQVMIVRQSSLSTAVALCAAVGDKKAGPDQVIDMARIFEGYVLDKVVQTGEVE
jgi:hypothetical protein